MTAVALDAGTARRAVLYLRVSTKEQAQRGGESEGFSIPAQREAALRQARSLGADVVEEFIDAGESARSANRPELQRMLRFVRNNCIDFVIVHKIDRLARNRVDDVEINLALTAAGVRLVSCTENIDETPSGMLMHGIMSSIAEFYSRNLASESRKGMLQKAKNGGTVGMAPFGYLNVRERSPEGREIRTIALDPERAPHVKWMFEAYATGQWTTAAIRDELLARGVTSLPRPNRPARPLAVSHVSTILQNRYYVGYVKYEGVEYSGRHEPLVGEALFERVRNVREARHQSREKPRAHAHYLIGSIYCGQCGRALSFELSRGKSGDLYEYFYCLGRQRDKNGCTFIATPVALVEQLIEKQWATVTLSEQHCERIRELVADYLTALFPERDQRRQAALNQARQLKAEREKLLQAHYADAIGVDLLKSEQQRIAKSLAHAESVLAEAIQSRAQVDEQLDKILALLSQAHQHYLAADHAVRKSLNQAVFTALFIEDDDIAGADLTPAFRRVLDDQLAVTLDHEVRKNNRPPGRANTLPHEPNRTRRERPKGVLVWERKNPRPSKVEGSNELLLVVLSSASLNTVPALGSPTARKLEKTEPRTGRRRITEKDRRRIVELYELGASSRVVAAEVRVSKATVLNVLKSAGVACRPPGRSCVT
jgi:site-specific DNA recombinase